MAAQYRLAAELDEVYLSPEEQEAFFDIIRGDTRISTKEAAEAIGRKRKEIRHLLRTDEEFAHDYRDARGYGDDAIRAQLTKRAFDPEDPSDRVLLAMASAYLPEFADIRRLELTGANGGPVRVEHQGTDIDALRAILEEGGAFDEVIDGDAVEDAEVGRPLPGPAALLSARSACEPTPSGLPSLP